MLSVSEGKENSIFSKNETTVKKNKLAPRSSMQFKVGPRFCKTVQTTLLYGSHQKRLKPFIQARIDRGFDNQNGYWIGYKRNYFTLVTCFNFHNLSFAEFASQKLVMLNEDMSMSPVKHLALRIVARCSEDNTEVKLVQHTAKRDRGPQSSPSVHPAVPGKLPDHDLVRRAANIRNGLKIQQLQHIFSYEKPTTRNKKRLKKMIGLEHYPEQTIARVARYERVQFCSSINNKRPPTSTKHFKLFVELIGIPEDDGDSVVIARTETAPLVIRGRSPSSYKDKNLSCDEMHLLAQFANQCLQEEEFSESTEKEDTPPSEALKAQILKHTSQPLESATDSPSASDVSSRDAFTSPIKALSSVPLLSCQPESPSYRFWSRRALGEMTVNEVTNKATSSAQENESAMAMNSSVEYSFRCQPFGETGLSPQIMDKYSEMEESAEAEFKKIKERLIECKNDTEMDQSFSEPSRALNIDPDWIENTSVFFV